MRSIPAVLKAKLEQHLKAESNDSMQNLRIIATQITSNTLMSEPIHEDITMNYGDVALRQLPGEKDISRAYAICLDYGLAQIYQREFPANMERPWDYLWTLGPATDVGIEFQGTWELNAAREWYYLQTEQLPYLFWVNAGALYVQKWNDVSTKVILDTGVTQLSVCKGWQSNQFPALDQGLIVGYIKSGKVFYRAYCSQADGSYLWEPSYEVTDLGDGNTYLSVIRTNDFRIGFVTEKNGTMHWTLSNRNYAGMSFRPETAHVQASNTRIILDKIKTRYGQVAKEGAVVGGTYIYTMLEPSILELLTITSIEKLNNESSFTSYGFKVYVNRPVGGIMGEDFKQKVTISTTTVTSVTYLSEEQAFLILTGTNVPRASSVTITISEYRTMYYESYGKQRHPLTVISAVTEAEINEIFTESKESSVQIFAGNPQVYYDFISYLYGSLPNEYVSVSGYSCSLVLVAVSSLPI